MLALSSAGCFTCSNLIIGRLSSLGFDAVFYYNLGPLVFAIIYFVTQRKLQNERVLIWTERKLDWSLVFCYVLGAVLGTSIFFAINTTFFLCGKAGLNIGIAETVWGFTPFLTAILEFGFFRTQLQTHHIVGIACMLFAAALISLSQLFTH